MSTNRSSGAASPRYRERKYGPFHGGVEVAVWLNEVQTDSGPRFVRTVQITPRRYRDKKTGKWHKARSFRATDLPALILALEASRAFMESAPLPHRPAKQVNPPQSLSTSENGNSLV